MRPNILDNSSGKGGLCLQQVRDGACFGFFSVLESGYGAESRRKVVSSRFGFAMRRLENSVNPAAKWASFSNQERIRQRKEKCGPRLSSAMPKIQ